MKLEKRPVCEPPPVEFVLTLSLDELRGLRKLISWGNRIVNLIKVLDRQNSSCISKTDGCVNLVGPFIDKAWLETNKFTREIGG